MLMKTRVKPECQNTRTVYGLDEVENFPPELPHLIDDANKKLRECPCCGKDTAGILYGLDLEYGRRSGVPSSIVHTFTVVCTGKTRDLRKSGSIFHSHGSCLIRTCPTAIGTDGIEEIKAELDRVVAWWNKRPERFVA